MKRILAIVLAIVMVLSLAACGKDKKAEIHCSSCGEAIKKDVAFCSNCGAEVNISKNESEEALSNNSTPSENTENKNEETSTPTNASAPSTSTPSTSTPSISKPSTSIHTHSYSKKVTAATCTAKGYTTYTCSCGDTYISDYIDASHNYQKNVCTRCGNKNQNYDLYQTEYNKLTDDYNSQVATLQSKISTSNKTISDCQKAINNARGTLATLSPSCPQSYLQQYINNWQAYGSTAAATKAAQNAWTQQYNSQKTQLNNTITTNTARIQAEQTNITLYNSTITTLTTQYNKDVDLLKKKYGM